MFDDLFQTGGLSLERLRTLCMLAKARGITDAAGGDAVRQSQFSRQVAELEAFFGVELVNRTARPRRLTEAGRELAQLAQQALAGLEEFHKRATGKGSRLVIGAGDSVIQWLLLPRLAKLGTALPGVSFVFKNLTTSAIADGLQSGDLDLGLVRQNALPESMRAAGAVTHGHELVIPAALLPKAGKGRGLARLGVLPLVLMEGAGDLRHSVEKLAQEHGLHLDVRVECSSFAQIALVVGTGRMAGVLPDFARAHLTMLGLANAHVEPMPGLQRSVGVVASPAAVKIRPWVKDAGKSVLSVVRKGL